MQRLSIQYPRRAARGTGAACDPPEMRDKSSDTPGALLRGAVPAQARDGEAWRTTLRPSDDKDRHAQRQAFTGDVTAGGAADAAAEVRIDVPLIATGHLFAAGRGTRSEGDGVRELYVGSLGQVGADIFPEALGYVALGHIHGEQCVIGQRTYPLFGVAAAHELFGDRQERNTSWKLDVDR